MRLAAGKPNSGPISIRIPGGISAGPHFSILKADANDEVPELLETNNLKTRALNVRP